MSELKKMTLEDLYLTNNATTVIHELVKIVDECWRSVMRNKILWFDTFREILERLEDFISRGMGPDIPLPLLLDTAIAIVKSRREVGEDFKAELTILIEHQVIDLG